MYNSKNKKNEKTIEPLSPEELEYLRLLAKERAAELLFPSDTQTQEPEHTPHCKSNHSPLLS